MSATWYVYVVRCADGTLYTGVATDVEARIARHNRGQGARYTRGRLPVERVHQESAGSHGEALRREAAIKRLSRAAKLALIGDKGRPEPRGTRIASRIARTPVASGTPGSPAPRRSPTARTARGGPARSP